MSYDQPNDGHSPPPPPPSGDAARSKVQAPAIALMITAILGALSQIYSLVSTLLGFGMANQMMQNPDIPPELIDTFVMFDNAAVGLAALGFIMSIVVFFAALKMKNLNGYGFAMTGAVLSVIPCTSPCCCLGFPIGIWALVVLSDSKVKSAFR